MFSDHSGIGPSTTALFSSECVDPLLPRPLRGLAAAPKPRMKVILSCLIVLGFSLTTKAQTSLAITHVAIIDVISGVVEPDKTIVVTDNMISRVGPSTDVHPPAGARVIDAHGQFLIPGLWDMHVHLGNATEAALPVLVSYGITGVRDMGSPSYAIAGVSKLSPVRASVLASLRAVPSFTTALLTSGESRHVLPMKDEKS